MANITLDEFRAKYSPEDREETHRSASRSRSGLPGVSQVRSQVRAGDGRVEKLGSCFPAGDGEACGVEQAQLD
jgi:hypothetical protein